DAVTQRNYKQGQHVGTTAYFYTRDHLGSIREMFTGGGTVVARYDYDPYGRSTTVLGTANARTAAQMADWARREAQNSGLPGQHNGYGDAYRHCLWSCQMARYLNEWMAKVIGDNHEDTGERNNQDPDERKQDEANNAVGRCLGSNDKDKRDCIR